MSADNKSILKRIQYSKRAKALDTVIETGVKPGDISVIIDKIAIKRHESAKKQENKATLFPGGDK